MSLIDPCNCRLSSEAAATCPREMRGSLVWSPVDDLNGKPVGPITVVAPDGETEALTFGRAWMHFTEQGARDHARIRHLEMRVETVVTA